MRKDFFKKKEIKWFFSLVFFLFFLDRLSKIWVYYFFVSSPTWEALMFPYGGIKVFQNVLGIDFCLNKVMNSGGAWGILHSHPFLLIIIRFFILCGIVFYFLFMNKQQKKILPLLLIMTGAMSNILDYFLYGSVIDLFHFILWGYSFPVFNVADVCIFFGVVILIFDSLMQKKIKKDTKDNVSHQSSSY